MVDPVTLTLLVLSCEGARDGSEALVAARKESRASAYEAPSTTELEGAGKLFAELLSDAPDLARAMALAAAVRLEVMELRAGEDRIALVREEVCARRGRGFFAFRLGRSLPLAIEVAAAAPKMLDAAGFPADPPKRLPPAVFRLLKRPVPVEGAAVPV